LFAIEFQLLKLDELKILFWAVAAFEMLLIWEDVMYELERLEEKVDGSE
jgi:hypothetical protein